MNAEVLTIKGEKFAVLPFDIYEKIIEALEDAQDIADAKEISAKIASGEMECFPSSVVNALIDGENAVKVYREYRGLTQAELAQKAGVSVVMIKKLEAGKTTGSIKTLKAIALALKLDVDDLI
ncbi:MAG: helix-turn-helix domain-containing protein [Alphaproteobacteria bacterium]|nr:helix-turn-helix domain-containing protein [Alphaproteobacteria bacterium]